MEHGAASEAAQRFFSEGRNVRIAIPPVPGTDFNDVLNLAAPIHRGEEVRHVA